MKNPIDFNKLVPPGRESKGQIRFLICSLIISFLYTFLVFSLRIFYAIESLYVNYGDVKVLRDGAVMQDFSSITHSIYWGFAFISICMIVFVVYNYMYFYIGSKSIYLMKRLPKRSELLKRCISFPLFGIIVSFLSAFALNALYYTVYLIVTPAECMGL